jgi:hypothetical protein
MSKPNKANKNNYSQAGRLTPDELGRELQKAGRRTGVQPSTKRARKIKVKTSP